MILFAPGWLGAAYPYVKAAHVVLVIFWMAGLFMLPRFYAYHQEARSGTSEWRQWSEREARLIRIILKPAMLLVWALGLALVTNIGAGGQRWFQVKFAFVVLLTIYQFWLVAYAARFTTGEQLVANRTMRLLNEVPALAAIVIVVMAVAKPF